MKLKLNRTILLSFFITFSNTSLFSQERGLDERINDAFTPVANWWEGLVLHNFPGTEIPTIISFTSRRSTYSSPFILVLLTSVIFQ